MPVYPAAKKLLIPAGSNDPRIKPRVAILHVDAGNAESLYTFFRDRSGGIESHFHVRKDGVVEQYRDTDYQADANLDANDFAVSIETQGFGEGEWTNAQLDAIKALLLWLNKVHGIPLVKCPRWDGAGVGYHTLFGAPSHWTPVAKSCPGPDRKVQFEKVLVPWMRTALKPAPPKPAPVKGLTIGCHNLHDEAGVPTLFADVLFFTEAIAPTIRARVKRRVARARVALAGYRVVSAPENRTVVVAVKRRLFKVTGKEWHRAHGGKATLTPARGTLLVRGVMRGTRQPVSFLAEHRINDSWKSGARELDFRKTCWRKHTDMTTGIARGEIDDGRTVFAGGDTNTIRSMSAYEGVLSEAGHALDRLGVSPDMNITKAEVLSRRGSDHPRVRATVTPKESK